MSSGIQIRRAFPSDASAITNCLERAFAPYRPAYTAKAYRDTVPLPGAIEQRLEQMIVLVAVTVTGEIAGTVACAERDAREGHLRGFAVVPECQGTAIAAQLLNAAEQELLARGCVVVTLDTTEPLQRAIRFYVKHGYRSSGRVGDFFGMSLFEYRKVFGG